MNETLEQRNKMTPAIPILPPEFAQRKADALSICGEFKAVATAAEQADALAAASLAKGLVKGVDDARKELKRKIQDVSDEATKELQTEIARLESLASDFQRAQDARATAERRAAEQAARAAAEAAETARLTVIDNRSEMDLRHEAERRADNERVNTLEQRLRAAHGTGDLECVTMMDKAYAEADANAERRSREVADEQARINALEENILDRFRDMQSARRILPPKPAGGRVLDRLNFEVTDIEALRQARPDLVHCEPKRALILAAIAIPNAPALPGIRVFRDMSVSAGKASV